MYFIKSGGKVVNTHLGLEVNVAAPFLRKVSESLIADRASGCRFAKLTLNSAYGRFAARHSSEPDRLANITREDAHTYAGAGSCLKYKSLYLIRGEGVTAKRASRGNIAAAAAITAKARVRLNELVYELECAGGVIICLDTDCVVFSGCLKLINDRGYKRRDDYAVITARAQTWGREY